MPNQTASSSNAQTSSPAQVLSPEARKALRKALKDQLAVVQKKTRHLQAKRLLGVKDDAEEPAKAKGVKHDVQNDAPNPSLADGKDHRGSDQDRGKSDRNDSEAQGKERGRGAAPREGEPAAEGLKAEAETFFSKGNRPNVGKTKSVFAKIMSSEQRSFAQDHKKPSAPQTKKGGGGRKK